MKKNTKKILSFLLIIFFMIGFTSCDSTNANNQTPGNDTPVETPDGDVTTPENPDGDVTTPETPDGDVTTPENPDGDVTPEPEPTPGPVVLTEATLYAVGDSTLSSFSDQYYYPRYGYATQLENYFDSKLTVQNLALSGRSSKSFLLEANYTTLTNSLKEGDYLLIGFGHNDEKSDEEARFTNALLPTDNPLSFKYSLYEHYIKLAEEKKATPILCTPIVRADNTNAYTGSTAHVTEYGDYAQAIVDLGAEKNVQVVNLTNLTKEKYQSLGYDQAIYYHAMTAGIKNSDDSISPNVASVDKTHLNIYGAKYVAYLVASTLAASTSSLGNYVLDNITEPTQAVDLVANPDYVVKDYTAPALETYEAPAHFATTTSGWYGTAFGDTGGGPSSSGNGYVAQETSTGVYKVGQTAGSSKGKIAGSTEGIAFLFQQVDVSKNFEITASAKVLTTASTQQSGFGLMLRDDAYINLTATDSTIKSNSVSAGFVTTNTNMNVLFNRANGTLTKADNVISSLYAVDDTATFTIKRVGQTVTTTVVYKEVTYTTSYVDYDFIAIDNQYMYVGMFATRGTVVEFTNVNLTILGDSQGA